MTLRGYQKAQDELRHLKNVERPAVVEAIAAARQFGDLSENAEYHAAKDKQGFIESRIAELEDTISRAEVIDTGKIVSDSIKFGATVVLEDDSNGTKSTFQIVGSDESEISAGLLSFTSPMAKALIGKQVGDYVEVNTPRGSKSYTVVSLKYV